MNQQFQLNWTYLAKRSKKILGGDKLTVRDEPAIVDRPVLGHQAPLQLSGQHHAISIEIHMVKVEGVRRVHDGRGVGSQLCQVCIGGERMRVDHFQSKDYFSHSKIQVSVKQIFRHTSWQNNRFLE